MKITEHSETEQGRGVTVHQGFVAGRTMRQSFFASLLVSIAVCQFLQTPSLPIKKTYIVYLGSHSEETVTSDTDHVINSHHTLLQSFIRSHDKAKDLIFYSYTRHINGFAAFLEEEEAADIRKHPDVVSVFLNKGISPLTTGSWDFLGLEKNGVVPEDSIWINARFGEDTIIGNIDTGVWPDSKSFSDEGMRPVPSRWRGVCQPGRNDKYSCNRKLIGVRYFNKGFAAYAGALNSSFFTIRDHDGHGTHTLSTAGGNFVPGVSVFGNGNGTAKGGSPRARLAAYRVCWPPVNGYQCFTADVLAAFDAAISDGVDVISLSLGGNPLDFFQDGIAIGAFHAAQKGVIVVAGAGNSGPDPGTVTNAAPWMITVGASTTDREFTSYIKLGNRKKIKGVSFSSKQLEPKSFFPLITGADAKAGNVSTKEALTCKAGTLDPRKVEGKILVCLRKDNVRTEKGHQAAIAGSVGMILANDRENGNDIVADSHLLPASHVNFTDGELIFAYINSNKNPVGYIYPVETKLGTKPSPFVAQFSSVGPSIIEQAILKPDVIAPGVSVIAAYTEAAGPTNLPSDERRIPFNVQTGTSMSCPHVAGIAGLLKTIYPEWSAAAIRSAIMTTATTEDHQMELILDAYYKRASSFAYGAGHVHPNRAMDSGLVYDLATDDYLNFLCGHGYNQSLIKLLANKAYKCPKSFDLRQFNYPSITILNLDTSITVIRRVKNVGTPGTYLAFINAPPGVSILVEPARLDFLKIGEEKEFKVVLKPTGSARSGDDVFGDFTWSDGQHSVRSPIVVKIH